MAVLRESSFACFLRARSSARSMTRSNRALAAVESPDNQWSKWSLTAFSTKRVASAVASFSLVWPWNCGSWMKSETTMQAPPMTSSAVTAAARRLLVISPYCLQGAGQGVAQAGFMGAAFGGGDGIAIGIAEAFLVLGPGDGPFHLPHVIGESGLAGEGSGRPAERGRPASLSRKSRRPLGNFSTSFWRVTSPSFSRAGSQDQRISTPR